MSLGRVVAGVLELQPALKLTDSARREMIDIR
jgi:hypothetical protein